MVSSYSAEVINSDEFSEALRSMRQHTKVLEPYLWQFTRKLELKFPSKIFLSQYIQPPGCSLLLCCTGWAKCQAEFYINTSANAVENAVEFKFKFLTKLFKKYSLDFSLSLSYFFFLVYRAVLAFLKQSTDFLFLFLFFNWLTGTSANYCICCLK